ncbi:Ca-activated chloride channel family protein [Scopulibacillus daqui]|uniref:Ca-activated chloride channel family protein n=1 Tax=Scopulibacillus daqui TaxID=1469162 RepID=A0ABS2Q2E4_9BACL|nr:VWA domain-containing protein [Scopulibacillus daqui]MBM7646449.1 Ca-activated chloride channel family protein [Scopulibacillus daqui]
MKKGTLKQILLITDGCSNQGEDPAAMAALAKEQGIAVNVIGVIHDHQSDDSGIREIEDIALAGGGISQIVHTKQLSQTVQMVTRQAMTQTIKGVINQELQNILGDHETMEDLPPEKRGKVMEVVDELGETVDLEVCILVDTSASMKSKLPTVQEALLDLSISLNSRMGNNQFCLYSFPGKRHATNKLMAWTPQIDSISSVFTKLASGGITPTGPAIREAIQTFSKTSRRSFLSDDESFYEESGY